MERQLVTPEEAKLIWEHTKNKLDELYIKMLWYTGGRSTEVSSLKPSHIGESYVILPNLKQHKATVKPPIKIVQIPKFMIQELTLYIKVEGISIDSLIFSEDGKQERDHTTNWKIVVKSARRANIFKVGRLGNIVPAWPHCFRHGNAQILYSETHDIQFVKEQLGHRSIGTTQVYINVTADDKAKYVNRIFGNSQEIR